MGNNNDKPDESRVVHQHTGNIYNIENAQIGAVGDGASATDVNVQPEAEIPTPSRPQNEEPRRFPPGEKETWVERIDREFDAMLALCRRNRKRALLLGFGVACVILYFVLGSALRRIAGDPPGPPTTREALKGSVIHSGTGADVVDVEIEIRAALVRVDQGHLYAPGIKPIPVEAISQISMRPMTVTQETGESTHVFDAFGPEDRIFVRGRGFTKDISIDDVREIRLK